MNDLAIKSDKFLNSLIDFIENPEEYTIGISYLSEGNLEGAFREFKSLNIKDNVTYYSAFNLGLIYWIKKDYVRAKNCFSEAFLRNQSNTKVAFFYLQSLFFLCFYYFNKSDFLSLERELRISEGISISRWKLGGEDYLIYRLIKSVLSLMSGFDLVRQGEITRGIFYLKNSIKWYNKYSLPFYYLAMTYSAIKDFSGALKYIKKALAIEPETEFLKYSQSLIYWSKGIKTRFLDIDEKYTEPVILRNLAWIVLQDGYPGIALSALNKGIDFFPHSSSLLIYKGLCLEKLSNFEGALTSYQKALDMCQLNANGYILLGMAFYRYGHYARAKDFFLKATEKKNNSSLSIAYLSSVYLAVGDYSNAARCGEELLSISNGNDVLILLYLHNIYCLSGELEKALKVAFFALEKDVEQLYSAGIRFFIALVYLEMNMTDKALIELNYSLSKDMDNPVTLSYKGFIFLLKGNMKKIGKTWSIKKSLPFFYKSLLLDPDCGITYLHLAVAYHIIGDNINKDWAVGNLLRFELEYRDVKIARNFFPEMSFIFDKIKVKPRSSFFKDLSIIVSDKEFLEQLSPFSLFSHSREEEILFFTRIYSMFITVKYMHFHSILSDTLTVLNEGSPYIIKVFENLFDLDDKNYFLADILNNLYITSKVTGDKVISNCLTIFHLNPYKEANTIFLAKILREEGKFTSDYIPVYEKCYELVPGNVNNLIALVRTLLAKGLDNYEKEDIFLEVYLSGIDFPEKKNLLLLLAYKFISKNCKNDLACRIYRELLQYEIPPSFKITVQDFLIDIYLSSGRLDEEALSYYLDKYLRNPLDKSLITVCSKALFVAGRIDRLANEIYGKFFDICPCDDSNFLMWIYSGIEDVCEREYVEKAFSIILSDLHRYRGDFWRNITSSVIIKLAIIYCRNQMKSSRAMVLYRMASDILPDNEKFKYYVLLSSLEQNCYDIELFNLYRYFLGRNDMSPLLQEKITLAISRICSGFSINPCLWDEALVNLYRCLFARTDWFPSDMELNNLWNYFMMDLKKISTGLYIVDELINYYSVPEHYSILSGNNSRPFRKGLIFLFMGYIEKSLDYIEKSYNENSLNPVCPIILYSLTKIKTSLGKIEDLIKMTEILIDDNSIDEAIGHLEYGIENRIDDPRIYYLLARAYKKRTDFERSLTFLSLASEKGYNTVKTAELIGQIYLELGKLNSAREEFEKLPEDSGIRYYNFGLLFLKEKKIKDAQDCFELAFDLMPENSDLIWKLAGLYIFLESYDPGHIDFIERALIEKRYIDRDEIIKAIEYLHEYYVAHSRWEKGIRLLDNFLKAPDFKLNKKLWAWLALDLINTGNIERAFNILNSFPLIDPGEEREALRIHSQMADKLIFNGDYERAREIYEKIYKCDSEAGHSGTMLEMLSGDRIGRFALINPIGSGANARVWRAFDLISRRYVALKVLHEELRNNRDIILEFQREYEILFDLNLPGIVKIIPESTGGYYFAMELLEYSLAHMLKEHKEIDVSLILDTGAQISEVLEQLHQNNIIYQDLSPDNIMFTGKFLKLCDFGGVKKIDPVNGKTIFGGTVAHLAYASPEQCFFISGGIGENVKVDFRSDIYSLGVLLYQMITGELPYNLPDQQLISAHQYSQPVPPVVKRKGLSKEFNELIMKCLEKLPENRFQSMKELWLILQKIPRYQ